MNTDEKINICLTTISSRLQHLSGTLASLLAQKYKNTVIHVYVSKEAYLLDDGIHQLPDSILEMQDQANGRLKISYCKNIGPYRKLLPFLYENWGQSCLVATADDDTIYPVDWLERMVAAYELYNCVIAHRGHRIVLRDEGFAPYRSWMRSRLEFNPSNMILPTGKDGVLYDTAFFPENVLNVADAMRYAPTADDLWFRWNLAMNGIPVYLLNDNYADSFPESNYGSSLYLNFNRGGNNDRAITGLDAYFKSQFNYSMTQIS
jgi:hypothetical protein